MEYHLNFVSMLTLREIALRKVAINLWNEADILAAILAFSPMFREDFGDYSERWREDVESKVKDKLSKRPLPKSFVKQLLPIIASIGIQILRWKGFHERYLKMPGWEEILEKYSIDSRVEFNAAVLAKLCWTSAGTVNYRETAKELICCEIVDILKRYKLACLYCLDDYIPVLWEELPDEIKSKYFCEGNSTSSEIEMLNMEFCFPYIIKGKQSNLEGMIRRKYGDRLPFYHSVSEYLARRYKKVAPKYTLSFHQVAFEFSVRRGNKAASAYFFQKLPYEEKEAALIAAAKDVVLLRFTARLNYSVETLPLSNISDLLCYLLSLMNSEQQMEFFRDHVIEILIFFMDWPWKDVFWKLAGFMWTLDSTNFGDRLWNRMIAYFREQNYYFPVLKLFQEFFEQSPLNIRKKFVDRECRLGDFFPALFRIQDSETIQAIFRNVDAGDKVRLVSSKQVFILFFNYIVGDSMHMVEVCLQEAVLSKKDRDALKEAFMAFRTADIRQTKKNRPIRNQFLQLLDKIGGNTKGKRSSDPETWNKAKKLCSSE